MQNGWSVEWKREGEIVGCVFVFNICYNSNGLHSFLFITSFFQVNYVRISALSLFVVNFVPQKGHSHISLDCTRVLISLGIVFIFSLRKNKNLALFFSPNNSNTTM
jgi:hypothetical protein